MTNSADLGALHERIRHLEAELRARDEQLQQSQSQETRMRQIMDSNMIGLLIWHVDGRILEANDVVLEITGYTREELQAGQVNWLAMTPPEFMERERQAHRELAERGVCASYEKEYIRKDGSRVPILIGGAFLQASRTEGVCFVIDISNRRQMERQLAESQRLFQMFMDNTPAVAFIKNAQGERVYLNRRYRDVFGQGEDMLGKTDAQMFGAEVQQKLQAEDDYVRQHKQVYETILKLPTPDGTLRTWLTYKFPVTYGQQTELVGGVAVDITELKRAQDSLEKLNEELEARVAQRTQTLDLANQELRKEMAARERAQAELRKSEHRFRKWLDQSVVPTQVVGPDGYTREVNAAWEKLWGGTLEDIRDFNLLADAQTEKLGIAAYLRRALAGEAVIVPETPFVPDRGLYRGQARWCRGVVYPVKNEHSGEVEEIVILHQDVTERVAAEQQVQIEQRTLRKLFDLQDQERKLIAYEIHDGLAQELVGAQLRLQAFTKDMKYENVQVAGELLANAINEARRLINGLRPLVIDEHGVVNAIEFLIAEEAKRGGPVIRFFHRVKFDRLPPLLEGTLFRIVQECLANVRRHSGSQDAEIWLHEEQEMLKLTIRDHGCGFVVEDVPEDRFGLEGISKRARIFGGTCRIDSILGEGTTIRVEIPLNALSPPQKSE